MRLSQSFFNAPKNDSAIALSQHIPVRPTDCRMFVDVSDEFHTRLTGSEVPLEVIGDRMRAMVTDRRGPPRPGLTRPQLQRTHEVPDELRSAGHATAGECGVDTSVAVGFP